MKKKTSKKPMQRRRSKPGKPTGNKGRPSRRSGPRSNPNKPPRVTLPPPPLGPDTARPLALAAAAAALDKKAEDAVLLDVRRISSYADYVLLLSAESERQLEAISREIEDQLRTHGTRLRSVESAGEANWLLMDFGDLVVHIFYRDARGFYDLEGLWSDAPRVPLAGATAAVR